MKKLMKKLAGIVLAMVTVLAMTSSVLAATITITGGASGSEYAAYKLLNATVDATDDTKVAYAVNDKYASVLKTVTNETGADVVKYIAKLDSAGTRAFADAVYAEIKTLDADFTTTNDKFTVDPGYYLIAERKTGNEQDTYSLVMLDTAKNEDLTINTKESVPGLVKKVKDVNDSTGDVSGWQDSADADVGDEIEYQLTGTVSGKYADYKTYYYKFHDTMTHLTYKESSAKVEIQTGDKTFDATAYFTINWDAAKKKLTATCDDLKNLKEYDIEVTADSKVVVTYIATLDADAVLGSKGNPNTAYLEYNNNPYYEGDGAEKETGKTPEDTNIVFTYKTVINKVDEKDNALSGATFTLEKFVKDENGAETYKEMNGTWVAKSTVETTPDTTFTFSGLDDGYYRLKETVAPAGYNAVDDMYFEIAATHEIEADLPKLTSLNGNALDGSVIQFTPVVGEGSLTSNVVNKSGSTLPSTGGMGTTIFYVVGSILVLGAAILLITKKRMSAR